VVRCPTRTFAFSCARPDPPCLPVRLTVCLSLCLSVYHVPSRSATSRHKPLPLQKAMTHIMTLNRNKRRKMADWRCAFRSVCVSVYPRCLSARLSVSVSLCVCVCVCPPPSVLSSTATQSSSHSAIQTLTARHMLCHASSRQEERKEVALLLLCFPLLPRMLYWPNDYCAMMVVVDDDQGER
jgi:hypothetical protein